LSSSNDISHRVHSAAEPQPKANLKHTETQARGQEIRWQNKARVLSADGVRTHFVLPVVGKGAISGKGGADLVLCGIKSVSFPNGFFPADSAALTPWPRAEMV
jgi:hypothetical protein